MAFPAESLCLDTKHILAHFYERPRKNGMAHIRRLTVDLALAVLREVPDNEVSSRALNLIHACALTVRQIGSFLPRSAEIADGISLTAQEMQKALALRQAGARFSKKMRLAVGA